MSPPRIMFDDGSRVMGDAPAAVAEAPPVPSSARGSVPLHVYYEVDRVAAEAVEKLNWSEGAARGRLRKRLLERTGDDADGGDGVEMGDGHSGSDDADVEDDGFLCRIALQFPDELLADAPEVSYLMEAAVADAYKAHMMKSLPSAGVDALNDPSQLARHLAQPPLLFVLGDTTYGSCCPDEVSANHLNGEVIVHYGHACLAPTEAVPVVYAFGVSDVGGNADEDNVWKECARLALQEAGPEEIEGKEQIEEALKQLILEPGKRQRRQLLVLYDVRYHHAMDELRVALEGTGRFEVVVGRIPKQQLSSGKLENERQAGGCGSDACGSGGCSSDAAPAPAPTACYNKGGDGQSSESCCADNSSSPCAGDGGETKSSATNCTATEAPRDAGESAPLVEKQYIPRTIGGLEIPDDLDLSQCTLLYIGDDLNIDSYESNAPTRLLHILLRCGAPDGPSSIWSYSPIRRILIPDVREAPLSPTDSTPLSTALSRTLRRRYFLLNKAKLSTTIAILIGTTSNSYSFHRLLSRTRRRIQSTGRTAYTFAVGKLSSSASKLTNFAEIDCFVLLACQESIAKFWRMEREEMLVPVLTPLELDVALGFREWDGRYSCDFGDLTRWDEEDGLTDDDEGYGSAQEGSDPINVGGNATNDGDGSSDDEPFFSMISGKYEQSKTISNNAKQDLEALPGQGKLIEYRSEAAEFLKQREYRGLEANVGETEVKAAVKGKVGIASNYGEEL